MNTQERTIKELLEIVLKNKKLFERGLCRLTIDLFELKIITENEFRKLQIYLSNNKPIPCNLNPYVLFNTQPSYWYVEGCWYPRKQWIKKHIKLNS